MDRIYEYVVIRLTSAPHRGEQINVGLAVFKLEGLDIRLNPSPSLVRAMGADLSDVDWIPNILTAADNAEWTVAKRYEALEGTPGISVSEIGWFAADDADQYEARIQTLRTEFVDRPQMQGARRKQSSLMKEIRSEFRDHAIMGHGPEDLDRHKIVSNVAVGPAGKLHIDFLLKNSVFHATETIDFRKSTDSGVAELKDAALASCTLQYAKEFLGANGTRCYFAYAAPRTIEHVIRPALQLAQRNVDDSFNLESSSDRRRFLEVMLDAAGAPSLFR
jgi:hypothetical protein